MKVSNELRAILRHEGYAKVAAQVMRDQGEYVGNLHNPDDAIRSVVMKVAANYVNEAVVFEGLEAYRSLT